MIITDFKAARHLVSRLGLGADDQYIKSLVGKRLNDVLEAMWPGPGYQVTPPTLTSWESISRFYDADIDERREMRMQAREEGYLLGAWWLQEMHETPYPLLERMTLFWHNHFTSALDKVIWPQLMYRQNALFREHALGSFADLLRGIIHDPAMLIYLDSSQNVAGSPNENFARELLELFTLGEGHYTEHDIVEAARAFTGWSVNLREGEFQFKEFLHDAEPKKFLGKTGNFDGDAIVKLILDQPRTAEFIAEKFWYEFVSLETPEPVIISLWANIFLENNYDIKTLLMAVCHSQSFWNEQNRGTLIKSPVEYTIGLMRELKMTMRSYDFVRQANQQLGQNLFDPPDVKGWRGGTRWIDNTKLIRRYDLIPKLLAEHSGDTENMLEATIINPRMQKSAKSFNSKMFQDMYTALSCFTNQSQLIEWLLPIRPIAAPDCNQPLPEMFLTLLKDPTYQLK